METQLQERRNAARAPISIPVTEESLSAKQQVTAINISEHGMQYAKPLDAGRCQGQEVFLTFALLERLKPIKALSYVVAEIERENHLEAHVTFMFLPESDEEMIRDFIGAKQKN